MLYSPPKAEALPEEDKSKIRRTTLLRRLIVKGALNAKAMDSCKLAIQIECNAPKMLMT